MPSVSLKKAASHSVQQLLCIAVLQAIIEIISNPVNSTVPIASEILKAAGGSICGLTPSLPLA
jgi:malate/lactate dehydrogenase